VTTLSTHVLDLERGIPAHAVHVSLYQGDRLVAEAATEPNGRIADLGGGTLEAGTYAMVFDIAAYLLRVRLEFELDASQTHYHVPLLMTPYACSSYRGA
jgi:5-hydroxyisourate hydrolase